MIEMFEAQGYVIGKDLHGAPYDWRLAPQHNKIYHDKLKTLIEDTVKRNGKPAIVITHSYGGVMFYDFLLKMTAEWKKAHVDEFIPMGAPFGGAAKTLRAVLSGYAFNIPLLKEEKFQPILRDVSSSYFLFPTKLAFKDEALVLKKGNNETWRPEAMRGIVSKNTMFGQGHSFINRLDNVLETLPHPGVNTTVIYGTKIQTEKAYVYNVNKESIPWPHPTMLFEDGDGTVTARSALVSRKWMNESPSFLVRFLELPNAEHGTMPKQEAVIKLLLDLVKEIQ